METLLIIIPYIALVLTLPSYRARFRGLSCWKSPYEKSYITKIHEDMNSSTRKLDFFGGGRKDEMESWYSLVCKNNSSKN